jgi:hypothetical protein
VAVRVTPPALAVIVTGVDAVTEPVATAKVALVAPCATDTPAGTVAAAVLLLDRETAKPPAGAADVSVIVLPCSEAALAYTAGHSRPRFSCKSGLRGVSLLPARVRVCPV